MSEGSVQITGICNGTSQYINKHGVVNHQLLIIVPGSQGIMQVSLDAEPNGNVYSIGKTVSVKVTPRFFNGRITGFAINK